MTSSDPLIRCVLAALLFHVSTASVQAEFQFHEGAFYEVGHGAGPFVVEDFDGNGSQDVMIGNLDFGTLTFLPNKGGGVLGPPIHIQIGESIAALEAGDMDGDNDLDIVVADDGAFSKSIVSLLNQGMGSFHLAAKTLLFDASENSNLHLRDLILARFDSDDQLDAIVSCESSRAGPGILLAALNSGDGGFGEIVTHSIGQIELTSPKALAYSHFDGNESSVLVGINRTNEILLFGGMETGAFTPLEATAITTLFPTALIHGDLDVDGDEDLLAVNFTGRMEALFNNSGLDFSKPVSFSSGADRAGSPVLGDFDGDGDPDLAVTRRTNTSSFPHRETPSIHLAENDGSGNFLPTLALEFGVFPSVPEWIETADIDSDGDCDILVTDRYGGKLAVYFNHRISLTGSSADFDGDNRLSLLDLMVIARDWYEETGP